MILKNIAEVAAKASAEYTGDKVIVLSVSVKPIDDIPL